MQHVLDKLAQEAGHEVIRLPPYHCDRNPIEMIWAKMKPTFEKTLQGDLKKEKLLQESQEAINGQQTCGASALA